MILGLLLFVLGAAPDAGVRISGVVIRADGRPAEGEVRLTTVPGIDSSYVGQLATADLNDGGFSFTAPGAGEFGLVYRGHKHLRKAFHVQVPAKTLLLTLPKTVSFEVKAVTADGKPRRDATLTVDNRSARPPAEATYVDQWPANDTGVFEVDDLPLGGATVAAMVERGCRSREVTVVEAMAPVVLRFEARPVIAGRVVDEAGRGVAGASVDAFPSHFRVECEHGVTETDADGGFVLPDRPNEMHRLRAYYPMYKTQLTDRQLMPGVTDVLIRIGIDAGTR